MENTGAYHFALFVRFLHVLSGIFWIGLLYFFNVVNVPFMKALEAGAKGKVVPLLMPRALAWFRYAALATLVFGVILLFSPVVYASPAQWDWKILTGVLLALIMFFNVWALIWPNQKKVIAMTIAAAASGTAPPPEMAKHARVAYLASRTNFWLSFPMLYFMIWAAHT
jgi:uncharacterized membrane protein